MIIACPSVFGGKGLRQHRHPAPEESLDMGGTELVTDILYTGGIGSAEQAVIQAGKRDAPFLELALDPLMAVNPDSAGEGGIGAELDKAGAKVPVQNVEVIVVDTDAGPGKLVVRDTCGAPPGPVSAKGRGLFLGDADEHHALATSGPLKVGLGHLLLSLTLLEVDNGDLLLLGKALHGSNEGFGELT